jgi:hypothetical protein
VYRTNAVCWLDFISNLAIVFKQKEERYRMVKDIQKWNQKVTFLRNNIDKLDQQVRDKLAKKLLSPDIAHYAMTQLREAKDAIARVK